MSDLRWTELAAHVVAWHNRHPLARHIGVQHVHSLGYVRLPFTDADRVAGGTGTSSRPGTSADSLPLPPEAMSGSLRERAMARAQLDAQSTVQPDEAAPSPPAPARLRPAFDDAFMPPYGVKALRRWAARQAVAQATPRADVPVRKIQRERGLAAADMLPRWVLTAQVEVGRSKTRVLVGPGHKPSVLGRRMISPGRTVALFALAGVLAGVAGWVLDREPAAPVAHAPAAAPAPAASSASSATPAALPASQAPVAFQAAQAASSAAPLNEAAASAATEAKPAAPVDAEPRLGKVELPSLGPRIDERRRRGQEAAASAASAAATARPAAATAASGLSFAVTTRLLRTRSESEQLAAAMRELLATQPGPPVRVEVLAAGDDWRVVGWPYTDHALADKARALLASRGMKVQVIDF